MTSTSSAANRHNKRAGDSPRQRRASRTDGIAPSKALGQHFLKDASVVQRIVDAVRDVLPESGAVVEVGPGLGVLTEPLLQLAKRLIAVEVDGRLASRLEQRFASAAGLTLVRGDVLSLSPAELLSRGGLTPATPYAVAANLPYNIGAAVLRHFLEATQPPRAMVVMLQREVARSVCAAPGDLGLLGASVQAYATARLLFDVPAGAFEPPPKVTSSVIRLDVLRAPLVALQQREAYFDALHAGFAAPRKQLRNALAQGLGVAPDEAESLLRAAGIDPSLRPAAIAVQDWLRLSSVLNGRELLA